jgi:hypothetical protein
MSHKDTNDLDEIVVEIMYGKFEGARTINMGKVKAAKQQILTYIDSVCQSKCIEAVEGMGEGFTPTTPKTQDLLEYIEYLIDLTIMNHEREPRGYTDPQEKQYRLGQRDSLLRIKKYVSATSSSQTAHPKASTKGQKE